MAALSSNGRRLALCGPSIWPGAKRCNGCLSVSIICRPSDVMRFMRGLGLRSAVRRQAWASCRSEQQGTRPRLCMCSWPCSNQEHWPTLIPVRGKVHRCGCKTLCHRMRCEWFVEWWLACSFPQNQKSCNDCGTQAASPHNGAVCAHCSTSKCTITPPSPAGATDQGT
jgi:hypothetical protein